MEEAAAAAARTRSGACFTVSLEGFVFLAVNKKDGGIPRDVCGGWVVVMMMAAEEKGGRMGFFAKEIHARKRQDCRRPPSARASGNAFLCSYPDRTIGDTVKQAQLLTIIFIFFYLSSQTLLAQRPVLQQLRRNGGRPMAV